MFGICFLIAEILLFIGGVWALITGRLPSFVFGKKYRIEGWGARIIGLIIAAPLVLAVVAGIGLTLALGEEGTGYASGLEFCSLIAALIVAFVVSRFVRQPADQTMPPTKTAPAPAGVNFAPRMLDVEPISPEVIDFARNMARDTEKRQLVIITPGRLVTSSDPLPPADALPPDVRAEAEEMAPPTEQQLIIAIGMTEYEAFNEDAYQAVPFLGPLEAFVQIGHAVILFEGHPTALAQVCRDADLLVVDSQMIPFLQPDWQQAARQVMRRPNIIKVNRQGTVVQGVEKLS